MPAAVSFANGIADRPRFTIRQQFTNVRSLTASYGNCRAAWLRFRTAAVRQFQDIELRKSVSNAACHGMELSAEKRMARNFSFNGHYTFGRAIHDYNMQDGRRGYPHNSTAYKNDRYSSGGQINAQLPFNLPPNSRQQAFVRVRSGGQSVSRSACRKPSRWQPHGRRSSASTNRAPVQAPS